MYSEAVKILWASSDSPSEMLSALYHTDRAFFSARAPQIHSWLVASCWDIAHLIPQPELRRGLEVATSYLKGEASAEEVNIGDWYAESVAFGLDYAETDDELREVANLIASIEILHGMEFSEAKDLLTCAAYFVDCALIYPFMRKGPYQPKVFQSPFLSADRLRAYIAIDDL